MTDNAKDLDIIAALERALEHTRNLLFRPFDPGFWLRFGFIVFIMTAFAGAGGALRYVSFPVNPGAFQTTFENLDQTTSAFWTWVGEHLFIAIVVGTTILAVAMAISLFIPWIQSRGQMMLTRAVAGSSPCIGENWRATRKAAWSLFWFRIGLSFAAVMGGLLALLVVTFGLVQFITAGRSITPWVIILFLTAFVILLATSILFAVIRSLLHCLVAPVALHKEISCTEAWRRVWQVSHGKRLAIVLFLLLRMVYHMGFNMVSFIVAICTCCISTLPFVYQVVFAPFYVFDRSYSLYILEAISPEFSLIRPVLQVDSKPAAADTLVPPFRGNTTE